MAFLKESQMEKKPDFFREVTLCVSLRLSATEMAEDLFTLLRSRMPCELLQMSYIDEDIGELRSLALVEWRNGRRVSQKSSTLFSFPRDAIELIQKGRPTGTVRRGSPSCASEKNRNARRRIPRLKRGSKVSGWKVTTS